MGVVFEQICRCQKTKAEVRSRKEKTIIFSIKVVFDNAESVFFVELRYSMLTNKIPKCRNPYDTNDDYCHEEKRLQNHQTRKIADRKKAIEKRIAFFETTKCVKEFVWWS